MASDAAGSSREGGCLCGAVRFSARLDSKDYGACHCEMCRRWTGSALLAISVPDDRIAFRGADHIASLQSSKWAMRAWCSNCGSGLYYRVTSGPHIGAFEIPIGLFDDPNGLRLTSEIYFDHKPDSFSFAEATSKRTRTEILTELGLMPAQRSEP